MTDPISDLETNDDDATTANQAAIERTKARIAELNGGSGDDDGGADDIQTITPAHDEFDDNDGPRVSVSEDAPTRQAKKNQRWEEMNARMEAAERRAQEVEARNQKLTEAVLSRAAAPRQDAPPVDPAESELEKVYKEQKTLYKEFVALGNAATDDQIKGYEKEARELDRKKIRIEAGRMLQEQGYKPHDPHAQTTTMIQAQFRDVLEHPQAQAYAKAAHAMAVAEGRQDNWGLMEESMNAARKRFGIGGATRERSQASRKRHTAEPARRAAPGGNTDDGEPKSIVMNKDYRRMARAQFPNLPEGEAMKRWANGAGKRILANKGQ